MAKRKKSDRLDGSGKDLRNIGIYSAAASGKTQTEIAEQYGLSRQRVNGILNSDEAKRLSDVARSALIDLQSQAVDTLQLAMSNYADDMKSAVRAAEIILKGTGALTEKVEHSVLKPFIMKLIDGGEIVMGHKRELEEEE